MPNLIARKGRVSLSVLLVCSASLAAGTQSASAQVKNWNAAGGFWNVAGNWSPVGVPTPANFVNIGNTAPAENAFINLNVPTSILSLTITDGMTLMTMTSQLIVAGGVTVSGSSVVGRNTYESRLSVHDGAAPNDVVIGGGATFSDGAELQLFGGTLILNGLLTLDNDTLVHGDGTIILNSDEPVAMLIDGTIFPGVPGITILQSGDGVVDLDGNVAGDVLSITGGSAGFQGLTFSAFEIQGTGLADAMDDDIAIGMGNVLTMALDEGWTLGIFATLTFYNAEFTKTPALILGSHLTLDGLIDTGNAGGHLLIAAPVTLSPSAEADLVLDNELEFDDTTTIEGGVYTLCEDAIMRFNSTTKVEGGTFNTFSSSPVDGGVHFDGPTDYDGDITIDGFAAQTGDSTVSGPTTIDADTFDMDGSNGSAHWSIGNNLVINAGSIEGGFDDFDGSIEITGTFLGKLTINLDDVHAFWISAGTLELGGPGAIMVTRIAGSPLIVDGDLSVSNAVQISADASLTSSCTVDFTNTTGRLRFSGKTFVDDDCLFSGGGRLENAATGEMVLDQGANLFGTDLLNAGALHLGNTSGLSVGLAVVDAVTFESTATWIVDLAGPSPGFQHDQLHAGAPVQLAGALEVRLIDLGGGVFAPNIGATFTILQAPANSISGAFTNQPVTFVPGKVYVWSVSYVTGGGPNSVKLTVSAIIPCPGELTGDGAVDAADLAILLGAFGPCPACPSDINVDGLVDAADLAILLGAWGPCPQD